MNVDSFDPVIRLYRIPEITGVSSTTVWRAIKRGDLPAPLELGPRARGYRRSTIEAWLNSTHQ